MRNIVSGVGSQQMMSSDEYQPIGIIEPRRTMKVSEEFREILNLHRLLEGAGIPHLFRECYDGFTIRYPNVGRSECFVTERRFNIGYQKKLLDICGLLTREEREADTGTNGEAGAGANGEADAGANGEADTGANGEADARANGAAFFWYNRGGNKCSYG